jgi:POT family proton-dependent oligopeptide transporter
MHRLGVWSTSVIAALCVGYFAVTLRCTAPSERRGVVAVIALFAVGAVFIFGFEQAGSWMTLFAARFVQPSIVGIRIPASWYTGLNAVLVVLMAPLVGGYWAYRARFARALSTKTKLALGLAATGVGFIVISVAAGVATEAAAVFPLWLLATYLFHTLGEVCISPVSLSAVTRVSPPRLTAQLLGMWYASAALGTLLSSLLLDLLPFETLSLSSRFGTTAAILLISGAIVWRSRSLKTLIDV